ncbi:hypothetical protein BsIDN1_40880 [Bacillus safensis]|uniref:Metalloenzyme domain-containing protein n=1 Tax=Bacillus safensis TaxID=561879 RepID=A0A5S9MAB7_BACIA|nr:hypothetical protein BsIDN1_40880 [Bacillus safensis]
MPDYQYKRIFLVVMDSVGIGEAPDAADFNDVGADTLGHIAEKNERASYAEYGEAWAESY